ncbi:MAG TPA: hypothetical protein PLU43_03430 [Lachnospiraceae bacterium]|nr:hypothetical protein [Lachnospiraceae bacterium]
MIDRIIPEKSDNMLAIADPAAENISYGGNQAWFTGNTQAYAGCGPVAAVNMLLCLMQKYPEPIKELLAKAGLSASSSNSFCPPFLKDDILHLMNEIYLTMGTLEIPVLNRLYDRSDRKNPLFKVLSPNHGRSIPGFCRGILKYAGNHGIFLHADVLPTAFCPYETGLRFIKEGLEKSGSVVLLTSFNRHPLTLFKETSEGTMVPYEHKGGMCCHFAVITDIMAETAPVLKLSTWGKAAAVEYRLLAASWQSRRAFDSALFYFTPAKTSDITAQDMKQAYRVLLQALWQTLFKKIRT